MSKSIWSMTTVVGICTAFLLATGCGQSAQSGLVDDDRVAALCTSDDGVETAAACGKCGDGYCNPRCGETASSCPRDCGATTLAAAGCGRCGDGYCSPSCETAASCPKDCGNTSATE